MNRAGKEQSANAADFWSGLALAALGGYIVLEASRWDYLTPDGPGAGFFPLWYGIAMLSLSAILVVSNLKSRLKIDWRSTGRALSTWLALAASVALFKPLGFVLSFALLTFFLVAVMYRRPLRVAALAAAASAAAFHVVFALALGVPLPAGALGF